MGKKFKDCFHIEAAEAESIFFLSEKDSFLLNENLYKLLTPLIDGHRSDDEIVEAILPQLLPEDASVKDEFYARTKVYSALMQMEKSGLIVENNDQLPSNLEIFCDHLNIEPQLAYRRLQTTKVAVKTFGAISTSQLEEFTSILKSVHIQISSEADMELVLTDDYLTQGLDVYNQQALEHKRPWMAIKPVGTTVWIGPIFYPGKTACWECLAQRLRGNRSIEGYIQRHKDISTPLTLPFASVPSISQTALGIAATEVLKWIILGENKPLEGVLMTHNTISLETKKHTVVKRPQCDICGELAFRHTEPQPIVLGRRKKIFTADGGYRCYLPEQTFEKYQHHISPITGVVRELQKVPQSINDLTSTYVAKHHFGTMFDDLDALRQNIRGRSAGKGRTDRQARVSALCEAIERYSGSFYTDEIRHKSSYRLLGDKAIHPNACMNFSSTQYQNRQQWNVSCPSSVQRVPEPFGEEEEIEWTPVWSLTHKEFKYLPTAYCYYGYPKPLKPSCWADSNGCAAGNNLEEAILQGFMELVERDSVAMWWYNRLKKPGVDLDSFDDPYFRGLQEHYHSLDRDLWVLDLTNDLNIPTFAAISRRNHREVEDIVLGYGAHFDPRIAISRALTEINQVLCCVISTNADGSTQYPHFYEPLAIEWWKTATLENHPYLVADESVAPKVSTDYSQLWNEDLLDDIMTCQQIVEERGMEFLVLDQTRPDVGLKVVKVIVPGMCHMWKRLGSKRLYQVPVQMGWLNQPLTEEQLNPFPMWM